MHGTTVRTKDLKPRMLVKIPFSDELWARVRCVIDQPDHRALVFFTDTDYAPVDANLLDIWAYFDERV